jgi:hypothetical protein
MSAGAADGLVAVSLRQGSSKIECKVTWQDDNVTPHAPIQPRRRAAYSRPDRALVVTLCVLSLPRLDTAGYWRLTSKGASSTARAVTAYSGSR